MVCTPTGARIAPRATLLLLAGLGHADAVSLQVRPGARVAPAQETDLAKSEF